MQQLLGSQFDPMGAAIGQGISAGFRNLMMARANTRDQQAWKDWLSRNQTGQQQVQTANDFLGSSAPPGVIDPTSGLGDFKVNPPEPYLQQMPPTQMPQMMSPWGQQMTNAGAQNQMAAMQPMNPLDQARTRHYEAQTDLLRNPPPEPQARIPQRLGPENEYGLPAGTVVQTDRLGNFQIKHLPLTPDAAKNKRAKEIMSLINDAYKPGMFGEMGEVQEGLEEYVAGLKEELKSIYGITSPTQSGDSGVGGGISGMVGAGAASMTAGPSATKPNAAAPKSPGELIRELANLQKSERFPVPAPKIVFQYPKLAEKILGMTPSDRALIVEAIQSGLSEDEILQYVR